MNTEWGKNLHVRIFLWSKMHPIGSQGNREVWPYPPLSQKMVRFSTCHYSIVNFSRQLKENSYPSSHPLNNSVTPAPGSMSESIQVVFGWRWGYILDMSPVQCNWTDNLQPTDDTSALSGMPWIGFLWCQISNISCVCFSPILIIVYPAWWSLRKLMSKGKQARSTGYILSIELFGLYLPSLQINTQCKLFQTLRWYHLQIEKLATLI